MVLDVGLAYEYDRYFSLSIARVDPLPHQLEAVCDYFLKLPRIRFLLADDPGAHCASRKRVGTHSGTRRRLRVQRRPISARSLLIGRE
jgi:hypothetical protein